MNARKIAPPPMPPEEEVASLPAWAREYITELHRFAVEYPSCLPEWR